MWVDAVDLNLLGDAAHSVDETALEVVDGFASQRNGRSDKMKPQDRAGERKTLAGLDRESART